MKLTAEIRCKKGTGGARKVRTEGKVPAIIYGRGEESTLIQIDEKTAKLLNRGEHLTLELDKPIDVLIKEIQIKPTTSKVIHIDFQRLHLGEKVKVKVPIVIEGAENIVKKNGILEQIMSEVELECLPNDIPAEIKVDVSMLNLGDSIHLKDLAQIKGRFITSMEATIVTVFAPKIVEEKVEEKVPAVTEEKVEEVKAEEVKAEEKKAERKKKK